MLHCVNELLANFCLLFVAEQDVNSAIRDQSSFAENRHLQLEIMLMRALGLNQSDVLSQHPK